MYLEPSNLQRTNMKTFWQWNPNPWNSSSRALELFIFWGVGEFDGHDLLVAICGPIFRNPVVAQWQTKNPTRMPVWCHPLWDSWSWSIPSQYNQSNGNSNDVSHACPQLLGSPKLDRTWKNSSHPGATPPHTLPGQQRDFFSWIFRHQKPPGTGGFPMTKLPEVIKLQCSSWQGLRDNVWCYVKIVKLMSDGRFLDVSGCFKPSTIFH